MRKKKSKEDVLVIIGYKDRPAVKQQLLMLAAKEGHGSICQVIRDAVESYLKPRRKQMARAG